MGGQALHQPAPQPAPTSMRTISMTRLPCPLSYSPPTFRGSGSSTCSSPGPTSMITRFTLRPSCPPLCLPKVCGVALVIQDNRSIKGGGALLPAALSSSLKIYLNGNNPVYWTYVLGQALLRVSPQAYFTTRPHLLGPSAC